MPKIKEFKKLCDNPWFSNFFALQDVFDAQFEARADLGFSRGGGGFKRLSKMLSTFFEVDQIDFLSSPNPPHPLDPNLIWSTKHKAIMQICIKQKFDNIQAENLRYNTNKKNKVAKMKNVDKKRLLEANSEPLFA